MAVNATSTWTMTQSCGDLPGNEKLCEDGLDCVSICNVHGSLSQALYLESLNGLFELTRCCRRFYGCIT